MFVDERLVEELVTLSGHILTRLTVPDYINTKGTFYTVEEAIRGQDRPNLEDVLKSSYYIIEKDEIKIVDDNILDEWI